MKSLSIEVSSIANVIENGDFELWENNVPLGWTATQNDGSIGYANTLWGLGVQFTIPDGESVTTAPDITQVISSTNFTNSHLYVVGFWYKNDTTVAIKDSGGTTRAIFESDYTQSQWHFKSINFKYDTAYGNLTIQITKRQTDNTSGNLGVAYIDNIYIYDNDWESTGKFLKTNQIKNFENFTREIEDDLFTFKSDALSFTIRNYGSDGSYFNTNDFETYSDRIFRFDILATYTGANGSDITKKMVLFSNNDTITKIRQPLSTDFSIQLYELSTLFKDNGWFLGRVVTNEEDEETYFKYNTYSDSPDIVANLISTADVLTNLESDIHDLIRRHFIPVPINNFTINNEIVAGDEHINVNYNWIINNEEGANLVLDIYKGIYGRVFLLLVPYERYGEILTNSDVSIWEIINGSTLRKTHIVVDWADGTWIFGDNAAISFVHDFDATHWSGGDPAIMGFIQTLSNVPAGVYGYKRVGFTNNTGSFGTHEDDLNSAGSSGWVVGSNTGLPRRAKCTWVNSNGYFETPDTYTAVADNMLWLNTEYVYSASDGDYTVSGITLDGSNNDIISNYYGTNFDAEIYRFPQYYTFIFKDAYPSDVLKDLCVSQDALWYLDYSQTNDDITLTIKNRTAGTSSATINDNIALREDSFVRRIKFDDLDGTIFRDDATRLNYFLAYYNSTYGGGRFEKEFEMRGYRNYAIGDTITYDNIDYFIKRFELYTNERKTLVTLFQKAD